MLFNLIPLGPLDGHYILPHFLSRQMANQYRVLNARYGGMVFIGLILLSFMGVIPLFGLLAQLSADMLAMITLVPI
jgi:Zn-dependent protease